MFRIVFFMLFASYCYAQNDFIQVVDGKFQQGGQAYYFMGTNFWYGMNLGAEAPVGNRARLIRELDALQKMGVQNLRIMGATEGPDNEPFRISPALQTRPTQYNKVVLDGLGFFLNELKKREMHVVVCLNNFWVWTGGMSQYLNWAHGETIPYPPPAENGSWDAFQKFSSKFYADRKANKLFRKHLRFLLNHRNPYNGLLLKNDPTIMAWQLCNEPRGYQKIQEYRKWTHQTARFIHTLDKNHLVSIGSEGNTGSSYAGNDFWEDHQSKYINYATAHIWVQNWGWFIPDRDGNHIAPAIEKVKAYLKEHTEKAKLMGKPLVIEEFGAPRDGGSFQDGESTKCRDLLFNALFSEIVKGIQEDNGIAGGNFWSWSGEGRPREAKSIWRQGDPLTGDPPHELQGWYSVYNTDSTTILIIRKFAVQIEQVYQSKNTLLNNQR